MITLTAHEADIPPAVWFSYHYVHSPGKTVVTQRIKLDGLHPYQSGVRPKLAHVTNYVFEHNYLAAHFRPRVHWQGICGKRLEEHNDLFELLSYGEGVCEDKAMKLIIGEPHIPLTVSAVLTFYKQMTPSTVSLTTSMITADVIEKRPTFALRSSQKGPSYCTIV